MSYTVTLADGTQLKNLDLIANYFISHTLIEREVFDGNLRHVTIESDDAVDVSVTVEEDDEITTYKKDITGEYDFMILENFSHVIDRQFSYDINGVPVSESYDENWQFCIRELTEEEHRELEINSRLDYLELVAGV